MSAGSTARYRHEPDAQVKAETGLTAELLLDGELAALVKGYICKVEGLEVHAQVCRYSR